MQKRSSIGSNPASKGFGALGDAAEQFTSNSHRNIADEY